MPHSREAEQAGSRGTDHAPVIGIVGLGDTGRALGLALQGVKKHYQVVGHDRDAERVKAALRAGAIDRGDWNLISVAEAADLLFLTEPLSQLVETLATVATRVRPGALITDTASVKAPVLATAERCVPDGVSFIGGHPILRRAVGQDEAARFRGAPYCLVPLPSASEAAMRVLGDLVAAIGAQRFYIDAQEHDALVTGVTHLPRLLDAILVTVLGRSPSASDLRHLAGPVLGDIVRFSESDARDTREALAGGSEGLLSWLDQLLVELQQLRDALAGDDGGRTEALLEAAEAARGQWSTAAVDGAQAAAFEELDDHSPIRDMLLGRLWRTKDEKTE